MGQYLQNARDLRVVNVFQPGNETGWVTPRILYDPTLGKAPVLSGYRFWMDHGTVGTNTLRFWGEGKSAVPGNWTLAHYLVPRDTTVYKDNQPHDTRNVLFKMVPDGFTCNHTGDCIGPIGNHNAEGVEYESLQNGTHDITDMQYIKGALLYAYNSRAHLIPDWFRVPHGLVAEPWGRRSDPWAGKFDIARSWEIVQAIRRDPDIRAFSVWSSI